MDVERLLWDPLSRRRFFRASGVAVGGGSAAFLAACGSKKEESGADVDILNAAIDLENTAIAAYTAAAPLLQGQARTLARQFLNQEKDHADALSQAVLKAGGHPVKPKAHYDIPTLAGSEQVLRFVSMIENAALAALLDAVPRLSSGELRATAASIVTNDAEHLSVIARELGQPQVPSAFVAARR